MFLKMRGSQNAYASTGTTADQETLILDYFETVDCSLVQHFSEDRSISPHIEGSHCSILNDSYCTLRPAVENSPIF